MRGGHWMIDAAGREHYLSGPGLSDNSYDIRVIAHACAQINRFTGHANRPYSVAEHQLLCADIAVALDLPPHAQLAALMHDAHEAYVGDVSSPVKWEVGHAWNSFEKTHSNALRRHFRLHTAFAAFARQIKHIDLTALATERRDLLVFNEHSAPWSILDAPGHQILPFSDVDLNTRWRQQHDWTEWRDLYIQRYEDLCSKCTSILLSHIQGAAQGGGNV